MKKMMYLLFLLLIVTAGCSKKDESVSVNEGLLRGTGSKTWESDGACITFSSNKTFVYTSDCLNPSASSKGAWLLDRDQTKLTIQDNPLRFGAMDETTIVSITDTKLLLDVTVTGITGQHTKLRLELEAK